jgi:large subunit ribosomal protein L10
MLREKKAQVINKLADDLSRSEVIIATNYHGLTAKQINEVRNVLMQAGGEYHVVKNNLTHIAVNRIGMDMGDMVVGPTALAYTSGDVLSLVRALEQCTRNKQLSFLKVKGGVLGQRLLTDEKVMSLASLPSREVLISQLVAQLQLPLRSLRDALNSPLYGFIGILQNRQHMVSE